MRILNKISLVGVFVTSGLLAVGQCTPDPEYTTQGIYPNTDQGLPSGVVGEKYDQTITVIVPKDTNVTLTILGAETTVKVALTDITVTGIGGLPNDFSYDCVPTGCIFPGEQTGCMKIYSNSVLTDSQIGEYPLKVYLESEGKALGATHQQKDTLLGYTIKVDKTASIGSKTKNFGVSQNYPNPCSENTFVDLLSDGSTVLNFEIRNIVGEVIGHQELNRFSGNRKFEIDVSSFGSGTYFYVISDGESSVTNRLLVYK